MSPPYFHILLHFVSSISVVVVARLWIDQTIASRTLMVEEWMFQNGGSKVYLSCSRPAPRRKMSESGIESKGMRRIKNAF